MAVQMVFLNQAVWSGLNGEMVTTYPRTGVDEIFLAMRTFKHTTGAIVALQKNEKDQVTGVVCAAVYCAIAPYDPKELLDLAATEFDREKHLSAAIAGKDVFFRSLQFPGFELTYPFSEKEFGAVYAEIYMKYAMAGQA
ncbi:hypothetical protein [Acetobacter indonesiensis]|uniref:Uncharacterized protein n=1 Tax=Acetobacter indonesiensis TaxID=104101 RepID=A0A252AP02_9PROT|nr:hypothetical protein [Acetobacter indonesiensis]OUI91420.1 hypothetical protein HK17_11525 [Acetobacter indonesiensis]